MYKCYKTLNSKYEQISSYPFPICVCCHFDHKKFAIPSHVWKPSPSILVMHNVSTTSINHNLKTKQLYTNEKNKILNPNYGPKSYTK
jgi:hypothetical protein